MKRRHFLALIGIGTPGIWIDRSGLTQLQKHIVIAIAGQCSFCGKSAGEVLCLAGVIGRSARVCNECIDHCLEILRPDIPTATSPASSTKLSMDKEGVAHAFDFQLPGGLRNAPLPQTEAELEAFIDQWLNLHNATLPQTEAELEAFIDQWLNLLNRTGADQGQIKADELSCSFCGRTRGKEAPLLAGPQTRICDYCISETAANMKTIR